MVPCAWPYVEISYARTFRPANGPQHAEEPQPPDEEPDADEDVEADAVEDSSEQQPDEEPACMWESATKGYPPRFDDDGAVACRGFKGYKCPCKRTIGETKRLL